jgi:hypothetical protein
LNSNGIFQKHGNYNGTDPINPIFFDCALARFCWCVVRDRGGHFFTEHRKPNQTEPKPNRNVSFSVSLFGFGFRVQKHRLSASASVFMYNRTKAPKKPNVPLFPYVITPHSISAHVSAQRKRPTSKAPHLAESVPKKALCVVPFPSLSLSYPLVAGTTRNGGARCLGSATTLVDACLTFHSSEARAGESASGIFEERWQSASGSLAAAAQLR